MAYVVMAYVVMAYVVMAFRKRPAARQDMSSAPQKKTDGGVREEELDVEDEGEASVK